MNAPEVYMHELGFAAAAIDAGNPDLAVTHVKAAANAALSSGHPIGMMVGLILQETVDTADPTTAEFANDVRQRAASAAENLKLVQQLPRSPEPLLN